jgi:hypothetical protein
MRIALAKLVKDCIETGITIGRYQSEIELATGTYPQVAIEDGKVEIYDDRDSLWSLDMFDDSYLDESLAEIIGVFEHEYKRKM